MRILFGSIAVLLVTLVIGCNTVSPGECWPNTSGGFGGGGPIPIGAGVGATTGDYPAAPPKGPLSDGDAPNPCVIQDTPCNEKCGADYENTAIVCGKIADPEERKACQDTAYGTYKTCREGCQDTADSKCRKKCAEQAEACEAECRKLPEDDKVARRKCWEACNNTRADCVKKCKQ